MPAQTASESAICGTWRGETKEANWMVRTPVSASASTRRILSAVEILSGLPMPSNWKPSRGPTSTSVTFSGGANRSSLDLAGSGAVDVGTGPGLLTLGHLILGHDALMPVDGRFDTVLIDAVLFRQCADDREAAARIRDVAAWNDMDGLSGLELMRDHVPVLAAAADELAVSLRCFSSIASYLRLSLALISPFSLWATPTMAAATRSSPDSAHAHLPTRLLIMAINPRAANRTESEPRSAHPRREENLLHRWGCSRFPSMKGADMREPRKLHGARTRPSDTVFIVDAGANRACPPRNNPTSDRSRNVR